MHTTLALCTRRRGAADLSRCPGAVGFCDGCPWVPRFATCRACGHVVDLDDQEHANRVTGGFGCGRRDCPPAPVRAVGSWLG